jgi:hypothetical protein
MIKYSSYDKRGFIAKAYEALKPNEQYWLTDNDYKRKYEYLKEVSTTDTRYTSGTLDYLCSVASFLLKTSDIIFKTQFTTV